MIIGRQIVKNYGREHALGPVDFEIKSGETIALLGESGSGKSTLLNILGLMDNPTSGELYFNEQNVAKFTDRDLAELRLRYIGFVHQFFDLIPGLSALENVLVPGWLARSDKATEQAKDLLSKVGLEPYIDKDIGQLSGGQKQRVAMARALMGEPKLILADEPTGSLDRKNSDQVLDLLLDVCREGDITLICATHSLRLAERFKQKLILKDGCIDNA